MTSDPKVGNLLTPSTPLPETNILETSDSTKDTYWYRRWKYENHEWVADLVPSDEFIRVSWPTYAKTWPIEIFESVIDFCSDDRETLVACALTCRAWLHRSRSHPFRIIDLRSSQHLDDFARKLTLHPTLDWDVTELHIYHSALHDRLLSLFPALLARKLTRFRRLQILGACDDHPPVIHSSSGFFLLLSQFASIVTLSLVQMKFTSFQEVGSLICSLPALSDLRCKDLSWSKTGYNPVLFRHRARKLGLTKLYLDMRSEHVFELVNWLMTREDVIEQIGNLVQRAGASLKNLRVVILDPQREVMDSAINHLLMHLPYPGSPGSTSRTITHPGGIQLTDFIRKLARSFSLSQCASLRTLHISFSRTFPVMPLVDGQRLYRLITAYALLSDMASPVLRRLKITLGVQGTESLTPEYMDVQALVIPCIAGLLEQAQFASLRQFSLDLRPTRDWTDYWLVDPEELRLRAGFARMRARGVVVQLDHRLVQFPSELVELVSSPL